MQVFVIFGGGGVISRDGDNIHIMYIHPSKRTHLIGDLAHAGVVNGAGVGGGAGHDELGAEERSGLLLFVGVFWGGGVFCGWFGREAASMILYYINIYIYNATAFPTDHLVVVDEPRLFVEAVGECLEEDGDGRNLLRVGLVAVVS